MEAQLLNLQQTVLTEQKAMAIINKNVGMFGILGVDGHAIDCTNEHLNIFSASKFKRRSDIAGKELADLYRNKDIVNIYSKNYETVRDEKYFRGIVPLVLDDACHYGLIQKVPVYTNSNSKLLGYFSQLIVIDDKKIFDFIYNAQIQQEKAGGNKIGFFEITTQDHNYQLTRREMECLFYTIRGGTAKVIARALNISNKTVEFHIENLKIKFGCTSKSGLIAKAIEMGYLEKIPFSI